MTKIFACLLFVSVINSQDSFNENLVYIVVNNSSEARLTKSVEYGNLQKKYITKHEIENYKEKIKRIDIGNVNFKRLPNDLKHLSLLEYADFSSYYNFIKIRWMDSNPSLYFFHIESKIKKLPNWIRRMKNINYLNLVGHSKLNFEKEIDKLKDLHNLNILEIELKSMDINLIKRLCVELNLKELNVHIEDLPDSVKVDVEKSIAKNFVGIQFTLSNIDRYNINN